MLDQQTEELVAEFTGGEHESITAGAVPIMLLVNLYVNLCYRGWVVCAR